MTSGIRQLCRKGIRHRVLPATLKAESRRSRWCPTAADDLLQALAYVDCVLGQDDSRTGDANLIREIIGRAGANPANRLTPTARTGRVCEVGVAIRHLHGWVW